MTMDEFQPGPHVPDIRKMPPRPEMPGRVPPGPEKFPDLDDAPEIDEEGDPTTRKTPDTPRPNIREDWKPDLDTPEEKEIEEIIKERRKKKNPDEPELPKKGPDKPTIH